MHTRSAFTLIELSIVLVIVGVIIGAVTYGTSLVRIAEIRAGISQISELDTAVWRFKSKYNGLPGDARLSQFPQFATRSGLPSQGDGDGAVEHLWWTGQSGEVLVFWSDLHIEGLISGASDTLTSMPTSNPMFPAYLDPDTTLGDYFPKSKFADSFIYLTSGTFDTNNASSVAVGNLGHAYIIARSPVSTNGMYNTDSNFNSHQHDQATIPSFSAYSIDAKLDDGLPLTGEVLSVNLDSGRGAYLGQTGTNNCYSGTAYNLVGSSTQLKCELAIQTGF